jgi:PAS domain S-box-containing protein
MASTHVRDPTVIEELERTRAYAWAALDASPDALLIVNADEEIEAANAAAEELFGYRRDELVGNLAKMLFSNRRDNGRGRRDVGFFSGPSVRSTIAGLELMCRRKDGVEFPAEIGLNPFETDAGFVTVVVRDVTARRRAEYDLRTVNVPRLKALNLNLVKRVLQLEALIREQQRLDGELREAQRETAESLTLMETLQATAPVGLGFVDRDFRIRRMNATLAAANGLPIEQQLGRTVAEVLPDRWPELAPVYARVLQTGEAVVNQRVEAESVSITDGGRHVLTSYYPVRLDEDVIGVGVIAVDITEREHAKDLRAVVLQNMAEGLAVLDAEGRLLLMNATASRLLGWSEDELLGDSLHAAIHYQRADGSLLAEEDSDFARVRFDGRTVRRADDAFTRKDGSIFPVAYSAAPLRSGSSVRGAVLVFHDTTEELAERRGAQRQLESLSWVGRIRDALDEDRMVLYSQPIVPLATQGQGSSELLLRMIGPKGEVIMPGSFLPVAEKYGQIWEIDHWVIRRVAAIAASGRRVHANLSADSIGSLDLLPQIERELSDAGADPGNVVFEITETALMGNIDAGEALARGLTQIGCGLALDDFGTGYASFTYLQKLPFTYLKIDVAFVRDLVSSEPSQRLARAIVSIAREFGQQTIAEGVEDSVTLELLRAYGVDLVQGYHVGQPQPIEPA